MNVEGARCSSGHSLEIVSEGYGLCTTSRTDWWWPWRFTPPLKANTWKVAELRAREGGFIPAWVTRACASKQEALDFINADIAAHRALPFDEERERSRLVAV